MTAGERILQFIDSKGFGEGRKGKSLRAFYDSIGVPTGSFKADRSIGSDNLMKVFLKYPDLNMDWVITGRGEMLISSTAAQENGDLKLAVKALNEHILQLTNKLVWEQQTSKEWKEKYYQLLDAKITVSTPDSEELKKAQDVAASGNTAELGRTTKSDQ